jgi:HEAT repeat protein
MAAGFNIILEGPRDGFWHQTGMSGMSLWETALLIKVFTEFRCPRIMSPLAFVLVQGVGLLAFARQAESEGVPELLRKLGSEDVAVRAQAQADLVKRGPRIRPEVEKAVATATEEVRGRIREVIRAWIPELEEEFALACQKRAEPFPACEEQPFTLDGGTVEEALARLSEATGLKITFYPEDDPLRGAARQAKLPEGPSFVFSNAEEMLSGLLLRFLEATTVVDQGRLVVVRLSPKVLLGQLAREPDAQRLTALTWEMVEFTGNRPLSDGYWAGIHQYLKKRSFQQGEGRRKWFDFLSAVAREGSRPPGERTVALSGLSWFAEEDGHTAPDVLEVILKLAQDRKADPGVRRQALASLIQSNRSPAAETVLSILESEDDRVTGPLLLELGVAISRGRSPWPSGRMGDDEARRWTEALREKEASPDRALSQRATCVAALLGAPVPAERLKALDLTLGGDSRTLVLETIRAAFLRKEPGILDLIKGLSSHKEAEVRALTAMVLSACSGGADRSRESKLALRLLEDPSAGVRWAAVRALSSIYEPNAPEQVLEGLDDCRGELNLLLTREQDRRVQKEIRRTLGRIAEDRSATVRYLEDKIPAPLKR